ncbi:Bug family tripartite tricarboxylate transporter substrate binding protein [Piscinibacter koreensis]|uniref:Tripartite tricarboxylate transporter substrate binding protein n=1 Tax=Piscinibacter koreensis TaxID=2742824 RepID=A0A7Y6NNV1_9BURK|nr:tripartite tricarboxylate transporter substrate binding protein [Schlegelella koreensis]NUZ06625.1 tripartite tricarboxylate transporter substrate binding protein [Schlegelella koreensis]
MERRHFLLASAATLASRGVLAQPAPAAAWPARPVRLVIGYPPGGSTDVAGRLLADALSRKLGQQVVVDNRAGAGGTVGAASVARAEADGYTLLLAASPEVSIAPITMKAMPYDPLRDLQPITRVGQVPFFLVVNPSVPANTLAEFIAYAKGNPGKLNYSSFGNNTSNHLAGELFKSLTGVSSVHVPYKGSGPSITDLIGGQVQYTFDTPPAVLEHVRAGKLRALAVATSQRLPGAPQVPTFAEAGLPEFSGGTWFGLFAPARTPRAILERVNGETVALLNAPELSKAFSDRGIVASPQSADEFARFVQAEVNKWKTLAARIGIVAE